MPDEIAQLQAQLSRLVEVRSNRIAGALAVIKAANKEFDREALKIHRRITKLEESMPKAESEPLVLPELKPPGKRSPRSRPQAKPVVTVENGFTEEEVRHYHELLARKAS